MTPIRAISKSVLRVLGFCIAAFNGIVLARSDLWKYWDIETNLLVLGHDTPIEKYQILVLSRHGHEYFHQS